MGSRRRAVRPSSGESHSCLQKSAGLKSFQSAFCLLLLLLGIHLEPFRFTAATSCVIGSVFKRSSEDLLEDTELGQKGTSGGFRCRRPTKGKMRRGGRLGTWSDLIRSATTGPWHVASAVPRACATWPREPDTSIDLILCFFSSSFGQRRISASTRGLACPFVPAEVSSPDFAFSGHTAKAGCGGSRGKRTMRSIG